jgi:hypothetical protein
MNGSIWPAVAIYAVATLLDYRTTVALFDKAGVREVGPLVRRFGPSTVTALSAIVAVAIVWAQVVAENLKPQAVVVLVVLAALHALAAVNNRRLMRRVR